MVWFWSDLIRSDITLFLAFLWYLTLIWYFEKNEWNLIDIWLKHSKNYFYARSTDVYLFIVVIRVFYGNRMIHTSRVSIFVTYSKNVHRTQEKCIYERKKPRFLTSSDNHQIKRFKTLSDLIRSDQNLTIWYEIWSDCPTLIYSEDSYFFNVLGESSVWKITS